MSKQKSSTSYNVDEVSSSTSSALSLLQSNYNDGDDNHSDSGSSTSSYQQLQSKKSSDDHLGQDATKSSCINSQDCLQNISSQKNDDLSDAFLLDLSEDLGADWEKVVYKLGMKKADIDRSKANHQYDMTKQAHSLFIRWRKQTPSKENKKKLLAAALKKAGCIEIAEKHGLQGQQYSRSKQVETSIETEPSLITPSILVRPIDCIKMLKEHYIRQISHLQPIAWCPNWYEVHLAEVFTELELELGARKFRKIGREEIFNEDAKSSLLPNRLLIYGDSGIGKSTLCRKLAYDWAKGEAEYIKRFELCLLLEIRQLRGNIEDAIFQQLFPGDIESEIRDSLLFYLRKSYLSVLLIVDGLDELNSTIKTNLHKLIEGDIFRNVCVLVTSRPFQIQGGKKCYDRIIVNKGFSKGNAINFIDKYFSSYFSNEIQYEELKEKVKSKPHLQELACNPLNTVLLCIIWEDNRSLPQTLGELYSKLESSIVKKYCIRENIKMKGNDIPTCCVELLKQTSRLSFEGSKNEEFRFSHDELIKEYEVELLCKIGIVTKEISTSILKDGDFIVFLHRSVQDSYTAKHLVKLPKKDRFMYFTKFAKNPSYHLVLKFASYLLRNDEDGFKDLLKALYSDKGLDYSATRENVRAIDKLTPPASFEKWQLILGCLFESNNVNLKRFVSPSLPKSFSLPIYREQLSILQTFKEIISDPDCAISSLTLDFCNITIKENYNEIGQLLNNNQSIRILKILSFDSTPKNVNLLKLILKATFSCSNKLQELILTDNPICGQSAIDLVSSINGHPSLMKLNLSDNKIGEGGVTLEQFILSGYIQLQILDLSHNSICSKSAIK